MTRARLLDRIAASCLPPEAAESWVGDVLEKHGPRASALITECAALLANTALEKARPALRAAPWLVVAIAFYLAGIERGAKSGNPQGSFLLSVGLTFELVFWVQALGIWRRRTEGHHERS